MPLSFDEEEIAKLNADALRSDEPRGFAPDQMIVCDACLRANPPTRAECLYCAAPLPVTEASMALRQPTLRPLEKWEQGFNCILMPRSQAEHPLSDEQIAEAAHLLRLDAGALRKIIEAGKSLPLARATTLDDARLIQNRLGAMHSLFKTLIVADEEFKLEAVPPFCLHALEFTNEGLIGHSTGGNISQQVLNDHLQLIVTGRLYVRRVEVQERLRRGRAEDEIIETHEFGADEALLDVYARLENEAWSNWRISSASFDFSCLGEKKKLLATQNFQTLTTVLRERGSAASFDDSYHNVRHLLSSAWPLEQRTEARGWHRERPGKYRTEAVVTSDNEKQFTLYSRLQHYLWRRDQGFAK